MNMEEEEYSKTSERLSPFYVFFRDMGKRCRIKSNVTGYEETEFYYISFSEKLLRSSITFVECFIIV